ncbi:MAG: SBBP repeat-containing protein, partial [Campylobacterales bacterium]|nr:SBBP repeat-containing protein [Campylobacterales bacterium]
MFRKTILLSVATISTIYAANPTVTSSPTTSIQTGSSYQYTPTASDVDGDITNWSVTSATTLPSWLSLTQQTTVETFAGTGVYGSTNGDRLTAQFQDPHGIAVDSVGNIYVADFLAGKIRKIDTSGNVSDFMTGLLYICSIVIDNQDRLYITRWANIADNVMRVDDLSTPVVTKQITLTGELPLGISVDNNGKVYVTESTIPYSVYQIDENLTTATNLSIAGLSFPYGIVAEPNGDIYIADRDSGKIIKRTATGDVSDYATGLTGPRGLIRNNGGDFYVTSTGAINRVYDSNKTIEVLKSGLGVRVNDMIIHDNALYVAERDGWKIHKLTFGAKLSGAPSSGDVGSHDVNLTVTDGSANATQNFTIDVTAIANSTPTIASTPITTAQSSALYEYNVSATDSNNDPFEWAVSNGTTLPSWLNFSSDYYTQTDAKLNAPSYIGPEGIAFDSVGNAYIVDFGAGKINRVRPDGTVDTPTPLVGAAAVAIDKNDNIFVANFTTGAIHKFDTSGNEIAVANAAQGLGGTLSGIAVDNQGWVYATGNGASKVYKIDDALSSDAITIMSATDGLLLSYGIAVDKDGNLFVVSNGNGKVFKRTPSGVVSEYLAGFTAPKGVAVDGRGNLYVSSQNKITFVEAGSLNQSDIGTNTIGLTDGNATTATFYAPTLMTMHNGSLYVADRLNDKIRTLSKKGYLKGTPSIGDLGIHDVNLTLSDSEDNVTQNFQITVSLSAYDEVIEDIAGNTNSNKVSATQLNSISGVSGARDGIDYTTALDAKSDYVHENNPTAAEIQSVIDGVNSAIDATNNAPVVTSTPITTIQSGSYYEYNLTATDADNDLLKWSSKTVPSWLTLDSTYSVANYAGSGTQGGANGAKATAEFNQPYGIVQDGSGNFYIGDQNGLRKIDSSGSVTTLYSGGGVRGVAINSSGTIYLASDTKVVRMDSNGTQTEITGFNDAYDIVIDSNDNVFVSEGYGNKITKILPDNSKSDFVTGLNYPTGMAIDKDNNIYLAEYGAKQLQKITPAGDVSVYGVPSYWNGRGAVGITLDQDNNLYVTDLDNNELTKVTPAGLVYVLVTNDNSISFSGSLLIGGDSNFYVASKGNHTIKKVAYQFSLKGTPSATDTGSHSVSLEVTDSKTPLLHNFNITVTLSAYDEVVEDINGNGNATGVSSAQLNSIAGVSGARTGVSYSTALANGSYADRNNPTATEIQAVIDAENARLDAIAAAAAAEAARQAASNAALEEVKEDIAGNANAIEVTPTQLNAIIGVSGARDGISYLDGLQGWSYNDQSNPSTTEIQDVIDSVNAAYDEIVEDIAGNANGVPATAPQLNSIEGVSGAVDGVDYSDALAKGSYANRTQPTPAEIQAVIDSVNANVNKAPVVTSTPIISAEVGTLYSYIAMAMDADNDKLEWSDASVPSWLSFGSGLYVDSDLLINAPTYIDPEGIAFTTSGNAYITDFGAGKIIRVRNDGVGTIDEFKSLVGAAAIAIDKNDNIFVATYGGSIYKFDTSGNQLAVATPTQGLGGTLSGIAVDNQGFVYVTGSSASKVYKIDDALSSDAITIMSATDGLLFSYGIAVDKDGNLFVVSKSNGKIFKQSTDGTISEYVAGLVSPTGVAVDNSGNLYVSSPHKITFVEANTLSQSDIGIGLGNVDGNAQTAKFSSPTLMNFYNGSLYIVDRLNKQIRTLANKGMLSGTPTLTDVGTHTVIVGVSDGKESAEHSFEIEVTMGAYGEAIEDIAGNANGVPVTAVQLNSIEGVSGAVDGVDYSDALAKGSYANPNAPTAAEIQKVIDGVNSATGTPILEESNSSTDSTQTPNPETPNEGEGSVGEPLSAQEALGMVVQAITGTSTKIPASTLNAIDGVEGAMDGVDYAAALSEANYSNPNAPTAAEIQRV